MEIDALREVEVFRGMGDAHLRKILEISKTEHYSEGSTVFEEGSSGDALYVIVSGMVEISKGTGGTGSKRIAVLESGDFFGEMALIDDWPRSALAKAVEDTRLMVIEKEEFGSLCEAEASVGMRLLMALMKMIAPRIRQTDTELVALYETGKIISSVFELEPLLENILAVLTDAVGAQRGIIFLLDPSGTEFQARAVIGLPEEMLLRLSGKTEPGLAERILEDQGTVVVDDLDSEPDLQALPRSGYECKTMLGTPLKVQNRAIGVVILGDKTPPFRGEARFTSGDATLLEAVGAQAATAIDNARLYAETEDKKKLDRVYFRM